MHSVVTFLLTQNPEAATRFYRDTLGFQFVRDDGYALIFHMKGVMLRIGKVPSFTPAQSTVLGWESLDLGGDIDWLTKRGVTFERFPNMNQDEQGICTFPTTGDKVAWFKDPDGNVLSISQHAPVPV
jgi:catechol 2,3-dioxygenase-like lactoylglutathione lyase family enzyme